MKTYPENIEQKIDFSVIRQELRRYCASSLGRELVEEMHFETDYGLIVEQLQLTREMKQAMEDAALSFPRGEIHDVREALSRIRIEGLFLDEAELESIRKTLEYAVEWERFVLSLDEQRFALLKTLTVSDTRTGIGEVVRLINRVLDKYGRLADSASPELARIRHELVQVQGSVGRVLQQILRSARADGIIDKDAAPTLREGRLVIPVPPAYKRKIGGIVHDESATGKTVFVEPQQVVEANNQIRELEGAERRERVRILVALTAELRPMVPAIVMSEQVLARVDFVRAKVQLAQALKAICPQVEDMPLIDWQGARHPVLYLKFLPLHKEVVPLSMRLQQSENRLLIISGPNAGGKSVCLKTVALIQYMVQCGLLVPLAESSRVGVFSRLMIDIGDEQSIEDDLSTYSGHLRNMKTFIHEADEKTLILIDELGGGTEPLIGGAIAEAVLQQLHGQGVFGVVTTHYTNLKHFAEQTSGVVNGAMLYDRGQMRPLFQLSIGQAGSSFAVEIARQIGLPQAIIETATQLVGEEHIDYDKQLQDIARDKRYWENKRQNIRQHEKRLEERMAYYEQEIAQLKAKRREMLNDAKEEAANILRESNKTIERTIREIQESKADKARTRAARQKLEAQKQKVGLGPGPTSNTSNTSTSTPGQAKRQQKQPMRDFRDLKALTKDPTRLIQETGTPGKRVHTTVVDELRRKKLHFERTLDVRGMRADEALETFIAYLDDAVMVSAGEVTILHGTGTGALKQVIRDYLAGYNRQLRRRGAGEIHYGDGDVNRGGAGLTVIEL